MFWDGLTISMRTNTLDACCVADGFGQAEASEEGMLKMTPNILPLGACGTPHSWCELCARALCPDMLAQFLVQRFWVSHGWMLT